MSKKIKAKEYMNWDKTITNELTPLQALQDLSKLVFIYGGAEQYKIIETALKEYELMKEIRITARFDLEQVNKEHKVLEIIKRNPSDVIREIEVYDTWEEWCEDWEPSNGNNGIRNKEEFYLLKEILK